MVRSASRVNGRYVGPGSPCLVEWVAGARGLRSTLVRRAALVLATLAVATLALAARADAFVYWTDQATDTIARANLDGTGVNQSFITGAGAPDGVAVDGTQSTGRSAPLPRSGGPTSTARASTRASSRSPTQTVLTGWRSTAPTSTGRTSPARSGAPTSTARASTRASSPAQTVLTGWRLTALTSTGLTSDTGTIGRANLDGTGVNQSFITGANTSAPTG